MNHGKELVFERPARNVRRVLSVARSREHDGYARPAEDKPAEDKPAEEKPAEDKSTEAKTEAPSRSRKQDARQDPEQKTAAPNDDAPQKGDGDGNGGRFGFVRRHPLLVAASVVALVAALGAGYVYWDYTSHFEATDDAFIAARQFAVAPKVSGYITAVPVTDNEHVDAGAVIAVIDDRDYRTALAQAEAQRASAEANVRNIDAQTNVQKAQIAQSQAQVDQAQSSLTFAEQQAARYQTLEKTGAGSEQYAQQYSSTLDQQRAAVKTAQAALVAAQGQVEALHAQRGSAEASVAQANAQVDQARLNLSYTVVTAAQPGRIVQLGAGVGQFAAAGTDLTMFVPDEHWVTANFKETQLDRMRPGQPVTLTIDAYPDHVVQGHVASVQPGSGTAFSLLPAQNATGNYVKIVQRVPVRIDIDNAPTDVAIGPGMSVEPSVRVDPQPSIYEKERARL